MSHVAILRKLWRDMLQYNEAIRQKMREAGSRRSNPGGGLETSQMMTKG